MPANDFPAGGTPRSRLDHELPALYDELRAMARAHLRGERPGHTLDSIDLAHEAYLRLIGLRAIDWADRNHVVAMASRAMRRILIDHARARGRLKRVPAPRPASAALAALDPADRLTLDAALTTLGSRLPRSRRIVEYRVFAGMTIEETAAALELSVATVKRDWAFARAWLEATITARSVRPLPVPSGTRAARTA